MPKLYFKLFAGFILMTLLMSCASHPPLSTTRFVDPDKFSGEWYVISNIPYFGERDKVESKTIYRKVGENKYEDIFQSRDGSFDSEVKTIVGTAKSLNQSNTQWQSTFYWVMRFKFEILEVDDDYQLMLLGHRSRDYGWVMARSNQITDEQYQRALSIFKSNGYDTAKFMKVPQLPSDIGKQGFQYAAN